MKIGFTGTRSETRPLAQKRALRKLLDELAHRHFGMELHHGDCLGSDALAHQYAQELDLGIILHPPTDSRARAFCLADAERPKKPYLERNHDIVDETEMLIVMPNQHAEILRSGTWATARYARKVGKPITFVFPDGTVTSTWPTEVKEKGE